MAHSAVHIAAYSRSGITQAAAAALAGMLAPGVVVEAIQPVHAPYGILGYMRAGWAAIRQATWPIAPIKPGSRNHVLVICSPLWAGHLAPPVRAYLEEAGPAYFWLAALLTHGTSDPTMAFTEIEAAAGQRLALSLALSDADRVNGAAEAKLSGFAAALRRLAATEGQLDTRHFTPVASRLPSASSGRH